MNTNDLDSDDRPGDDWAAIRIDDATRAELAARVERLSAENRRLHDEQARRSQYRRMGLTLALVGTVFGLGAVTFPSAQVVLFAIAATGLFGGILTFYLSHGRFVDATVTDRIYAAVASNGAAIVDGNDFCDERIYVPDGDTARLFVPSRPDYEIPDVTGPRLKDPIRTTDGRRSGAVLESTGAGLFREFDREAGELPDDPAMLAAALADALAERFELVRHVESDVDLAEGRVTAAVSGSALGDLDRFDHPIASFLAVGLAAGLERPISLEVVRNESEWLVHCRWNRTSVDVDS